MDSKKKYIYIISEDLVFIQLIKVLLQHYLTEPDIEQISTFSELLNSEKSQEPDLIILDDIISGATIIEVISYLRLTRKLLSTICFFSVDVYDIKTKAIARGINYFYSKPFNPKVAVSDIVKNINVKYRKYVYQ